MRDFARARGDYNVGNCRSITSSRPEEKKLPRISRVILCVLVVLRGSGKNCSVQQFEEGFFLSYFFWSSLFEGSGI